MNGSKSFAISLQKDMAATALRGFFKIIQWVYEGLIFYFNQQLNFSFFFFLNMKYLLPEII